MCWENSLSTLFYFNISSSSNSSVFCSNLSSLLSATFFGNFHSLLSESCCHILSRSSLSLLTKNLIFSMSMDSYITACLQSVLFYFLHCFLPLVHTCLLCSPIFLTHLYSSWRAQASFTFPSTLCYSSPFRDICVFWGTPYTVQPFFMWPSFWPHIN